MIPASATASSAASASATLSTTSAAAASAGASLASLAAAASSIWASSSVAADSRSASSAATAAEISAIASRGGGLFLGLVGGNRLGHVLGFGGRHLLADLGEGRGEGVVDAALGLLDGVGHRVAALAALRPGPALGPGFAAGRSGRGRCRAGGGLDRGRTRRAAFLGLLEAEAEAMALGVEADDLELERLALVDDVARMGDPLLGQLADVDQALEPVADPDEGAEVDQLGHRAVDDVADLEVGHRGVPRVGLEAADRQADPAALVVDVDDLGLDLFADLVAGLRGC